MELRGGNSFVTDKFFENSGFSFVIMGANKKIKPSNTKNAEEKFSLELIKLKRLLKSSNNGINNMKSRTENEASKRLKLRKVKADDELLKSILK